MDYGCELGGEFLSPEQSIVRKLGKDFVKRAVE